MCPSGTVPDAAVKFPPGNSTSITNQVSDVQIAADSCQLTFSLHF